MVQEYQRHLGDVKPLGLFGFSVSTLVLSFSNAAVINRSSSAAIVLSLALFFGGLIQLKSWIEWIETVVYDSRYPIIMPSIFFGWCIVAGRGAAPPADAGTSSLFLFLWGLVTVGLWLGMLRKSLVSQWLFVSLAILYFLLAIASLLTQVKATGAGDVMLRIAGYFGITVGVTALYLALAELNKWPQLNIIPAAGEAP
ncbi:hypothetical protein Pelo_14756 [Pelomyxa schiedti]|nr:hypothetical protein Pelo_14756 [Pelomyxa schiedti]